MDLKIRDAFLQRWARHFPGAELPIAFYYTDNPGAVEVAAKPEEHQCVIAPLGAVRRGRRRPAPHSLCFDVHAIGCPGGQRYFGFTKELFPGFEFFLSCGIPGKLEGERYKKTPEIVKELMAKAPTFDAPGKYIVFKRWDALEAGDSPEAVIFYARPDVLSGLFTLAGFDESDLYAVVTPFCAGCGSMVQYPYLEQHSRHPRAVLGMFDVSARPWVQKDVLTFAVPMAKFERMIADMDESFLITASWARVKARL